jgi:hypothetical protein
VEEQDRIEGQEDVEAHGKGYKPLADVEGHGKGYKPLAAEDTPTDEGESDDVEAHRTIFKPQAADTPKDEGDEGDFELHGKGHRAL